MSPCKVYICLCDQDFENCLLI